MSIYPAIRYDDPNAAVDWLCKAFGFTADQVFHDDDGVVQHAVLSIGTGKIMVSGPREAGWLGGAAATPLASPISLYVVVDDPVAHHDRAVAEGATVVLDLQHMDYGSHEYSARDVAGNLWSFGTYQP
ncbi:VOC family protein [Actinophytocola sp.]|uniref:VOC family protein n=1 Tax=Actinophytocola sp. TaxID=1872138 RepID=UPI002ECFE072